MFGRIPACGWCFEATQSAVDRLVRGEEQRGEGVVVDGEWSRAGDRRGLSLAHRRRSSGGGGRSDLREEGEEEMHRRERESRVREREGVGVWFRVLRPESLPPFLL